MSEENIETQEPTIVENKQTDQSPQAESIEEINWKKFRHQREEERKQREAAEQYAKRKEEEALALRKAMEALVNKPSQQNLEQDLDEDQRINKKVAEAIRQRDLEHEKMRIERERIEYPQKLVSNFQDFNDVCTSENLDYLEYHYPEVAHPYKHMEEGYDKWAGLYKALKRFVPNKNSSKDMKRAEANLAKPQAMSKPGFTKTGDEAPRNSLDDSRKKANWDRMQKVMGRG
jgi:hypothetical protein